MGKILITILNRNVTAQQIIKKLQSEGLTLPRLSEILDVSSKSIFDYSHGKEPAWRCGRKIQLNYKIYLINKKTWGK